MDLEHTVIVDVEATAPIRQAEAGAAMDRIARTRDRFGPYPEKLAADTAYGSAETLSWLVEMHFTHLKRVLGLTRLRIRGPNGTMDEFLMAATVQNLRKLAMTVPTPAWREWRSLHTQRKRLGRAGRALDDSCSRATEAVRLMAGLEPVLRALSSTRRRYRLFRLDSAVFSAWSK